MAAAVATAVLTAFGVAHVGSAHAEDGASTAVVAKDSPGRATLLRDSAIKRYDDAQLLEFLVLGEGAIAKDHPQLADRLGFVEAPETADRQAAHRLMADYLAATPSFHGRVAVPLQHGDPRRVDTALAQFAASFNDFVRVKFQAALVSTDGELSAAGWAWTKNYVATAGVVAAVAGAVVYGAALLFHVGAAVTVITAVYLPGMEGAVSSIERDDMVRSLSTALGG